MNYQITHIGEGKFEIVTETGELKQAGEGLCGIIRYTYFEDYLLPEVGWTTTREKLMSDYLPKIQKDFLSGKLSK